LFSNVRNDDSETKDDFIYSILGAILSFACVFL